MRGKYIYIYWRIRICLRKSEELITTAKTNMLIADSPAAQSWP